jgi:hypothetical protein
MGGSEYANVDPGDELQYSLWYLLHTLARAHIHVYTMDLIICR